MWEDASGDKNGRITKIEDRNGYGITLTYKTWTSQEIEESPERQWQIDTVTDAYGRTATFSYKSTQESGQWVVEEIELPNGESISYTYDSGKLSEVDHPDGSTSSFDYVYDSTTNTTIYRYDDPVADAPDEDVYLTSNFTAPVGDEQIYSTSSLMVRLVTNGEDEVTFLRFASDYTEINTYEGGGVMKQTFATSFASYYTSWSIEEEMGIKFLSGTLEYSGSQISGPADNPTAVRDAQGRWYDLEYDSDKFITEMTYSDDSTETWEYNDFKQVTRYKSREGNVTKFSYDSRGNLTKVEVGLIDNGQGGETQQSEYTDYELEYYAASRQNEYLLKSIIDPLGNQTDIEYDSSQRVTKIKQPPDETSGSRAETVLAYDTSSRVDTVTDPIDRETEFVYDERDRVDKVIHNDDSTERAIFGTGNEADLVVKLKDRNGVVTAFEYDDATRVTKTVFASATMDLSDNETAITDP